MSPSQDSPDDSDSILGEEFGRGGGEVVVEIPGRTKKKRDWGQGGQLATQKKGKRKVSRCREEDEMLTYRSLH